MKQDNLPDLWWLSIDGVVQDNLVKLMDVELKKNTYKGHDVQLLNSEECDSSDWCKIQFSLAVSKEDESSFEEDVMVINEDNDASFSSKMTPSLQLKNQQQPYSNYYHNRFAKVRKSNQLEKHNERAEQFRKKISIQSNYAEMRRRNEQIAQKKAEIKSLQNEEHDKNVSRFGRSVVKRDEKFLKLGSE